MGKINLTNQNQLQEQKEYGNTFERIFGPCNEKLYNQPSKILLIEKSKICEYLRTSELPHQSGYAIKNSCLEIERPQTVVGFFLRPSSISNNDISLNFQSIHVGHDLNGATEFLGEELPIEADYIGILNNLSFPIVIPNPISSNGYRHSIFQFHGDAVKKKFMKSFVSWYELKCIVDHCDYLGLSGSLTMTGNIGAEEDGQFITGMQNSAYFTYRIIGFKWYTITPETPEWVKKKIHHLETDKLLVQSNFVLKNEGIVQEFDIPTETWAVPCPPMWKPR